MVSAPIVVIGTTSDYIDLIRKGHPGRTIFVTDPDERSRAHESRPKMREEILCNLRDTEGVVAALKTHLQQWNMQPAGIACFDCESLELAARIARSFDLPSASPKAIGACRNKFLSKKIWRANNLPCPLAKIIRSSSQIPELLKHFTPPVIIKPLTGSGSELVFKCDTDEDCRRALATIQNQLADHPDTRMYRPGKNGLSQMDSRREFVIETFIEGREYSSDVIVDGDYLQIIRTSEKLPAPDQTIGTTLAYKVPAQLPAGFDQLLFQRQLIAAAHALGIKRGLCMIDFIVNDRRAYFLELTPRPGGDCLPWLIRESCGLDMLGLSLDFAAGIPIQLPQASDWKKLVAVRFFALTAGTIRAVDTSGIEQDRRIISYYLRARPGHRVTLPPEDYDSRILGHAVFQPQRNRSLLHQCRQIGAKLSVEMESAA
jgi:biotin carboxylase